MRPQVLAIPLVFACACLMYGALAQKTITPVEVKKKTDKFQEKKFPHIILWSWEHDDRLTYIDSSRVGVAFYAGTIMLGRDNATMLKRKNPLQLNSDTKSFPAFRIETAHPDEQVSESSLLKAIPIIADCTREKNTGAVQIDFDATQRDKKAYLNFLRNLRSSLPADTAISITSLASWCLYDKWLQGAPVDETVAMMFSLGRDKREALAALKKTPLDSGAACAQSLGLTINEPETNKQLMQEQCLARASRVYIFSSLGWTQQRYENIMEELEQR